VATARDFVWHWYLPVFFRLQRGAFILYPFSNKLSRDSFSSAAKRRILHKQPMLLFFEQDDLDTAILFGDAASATILYGEEYFSGSRCQVFRPDLSAKGDAEENLSVPLMHDGFIQMKGRKVFTEAVRSMVASLNRACQHEGIGVDDLNLVVPHQANQRIIDAIQSRIGANVYSNIRRHGNTSSTSIPLCLSEILPTVQKGNRLGLCAFGGGFTFGASIVAAR